MAEEKRKPSLYAKSEGKGEKKPEHKPAGDAAEKPSEKKAEHKSEEPEPMHKKHAKQRMELHKKHRGERRDLHGNHRTEHDQMHGRHEEEMKAMQARQDQELAGAGGAGGDAAAGPTCRSCWGKLPFPHYRNNRRCPNYGKAPLPDPRALVLAPARTVRRRSALDAASASSSEKGEAEADEDMEDGNSNVCHRCSEPGELNACDTCTLSWHEDCLPLAARTQLDANPWSCPVCAGITIPTGFIGNPARAPPGRGGGQARKRFRSAVEGTKSQRKRAKQAGRRFELRFR